MRASTGVMAHGPAKLDRLMRRAVHDTIVDHARIRGWSINAVNVRTNHVHVVVDVIKYDPGRAAGEFKAWSTRRLREAGLIGPTHRVWTRRSSTRYLWTPFSIERAVEYVRDEQGEPLIGEGM